MHKFLRTKALIASVLTLLLFAVYEAKTYTLLSLDRKSQKEDKEEEIKERFGGPEGIAPGVKLSWNEHHNAFIYLSIDDEGRIFTRTYEKVSESDVYYYDVFDTEGKYIAKVTLGARPQTWKHGKLYTIEEDEEGFQLVKRYNVIWK